LSLPPVSLPPAVLSLPPAARPFAHDGGPVGVVLCHGFTGSPASMQPWASYLADAGLTVRLPRLPGHGTDWHDLAITDWPDWFAAVDRSFAELRARCTTVFVMGLSMGGTLALRLAETHGPDVAGIVVVNPSILTRRRSFRLLPLIEPFVGSVKGIASDISVATADEFGYDRIPVSALRSLTALWRTTRAELDRIDQPLLVFRSVVDHVVEPENTVALLAGVRSTEKEERLLPDSFHVATLDVDAPAIFAGSLDFIQRHAPVGTVRD
jgi:carboxylesterase